MAEAKTEGRNLPVEEARAELRRHFSEYQGSEYTQGWAKLWSNGNFLPWDRLAPSPALADTLKNHVDLVGRALVEDDGQKRRKRALVPGCGRGVDVLLLESFGYDVVGLEYPEGALNACQKFAEEHANDYPVKDEAAGRGSRKFVRGDFYKDDWLVDAGLDKDTKFDLIYDYTFFCAMQISMRPAWSKRMTELLRPSPLANLICLEFPTQKPGTSGGPPWASPPSAYMEHLSHPGEEVKYNEAGSVMMNPFAPDSSNALERVGHWHPADTHQVGKDANGNVEDYIAIWRHH